MDPDVRLLYLVGLIEKQSGNKTSHFFFPQTLKTAVQLSRQCCTLCIIVVASLLPAGPMPAHREGRKD